MVWPPIPGRSARSSFRGPDRSGSGASRSARFASSTGSMKGDASSSSSASPIAVKPIARRTSHDCSSHCEESADGPTYHAGRWTNRMVLGDSLLVMTSLEASRQGTGRARRPDRVDRPVRTVPALPALEPDRRRSRSGPAGSRSGTSRSRGAASRTSVSAWTRRPADLRVLLGTMSRDRDVPNSDKSDACATPERSGRAIPPIRPAARLTRLGADEDGHQRLGDQPDREWSAPAERGYAPAARGGHR